MMKYSEKQFRKKILAGRKDNSLMTLIAICLVVFVMFAFVKALWYFNYQDKQVAQSLFTKNVLGLFTLPADTGRLLHQPWVVLTNMFVANNNEFWKIFANMFWLWSFGFILQDLTGGRKLIPAFVYGALGGGLAFVLAYNFIPSLKDQLPYVGLGGIPCGVMGVAIVTTLISPGYRLFPMIGGGIPLWVMTGLYLITDFATVSISDTGTLITHLASALTGFLFIFFLRKGYDAGEWMNNVFDWVGNLFEPGRPPRGKNIKGELFYKSSAAPFTKTARITQERVDEILDKINENGYDCLSDEEREILRRASKEGI